MIRNDVGFNPSKLRTATQGLRAWLTFLFMTILVGSVVAGGLFFVAICIELEHSLPSTQSLKNYHPPLVSNLYAADGALIDEFYTERR
jgi:penicillin-binding protein 1A